ncbi:kinase-like domain-containing protein [Mycena rebaudengoi]|nr:kinase-like domain-containing protein [Mycena rebaudengoi]
MITNETIRLVRRDEKPLLVKAQRPNRPVEKKGNPGATWIRRLLHSHESELYQDDTHARPFVAGHMADVYRGKLISTNGTELRVAIKMVKKDVKREARIWLPLDHPNLVPLVAFVEEKSLLISRFYDRGNLGTFLQKNPDINLGQRLSLIFGTGAGLEFLHDQGIVHGDMKPSNVLIDDNGTPLICDFGISQLLGSRGYTTASVGTRAYIAPELWERFLRQQPPETGAWTTKKSDMYSFGILVLETLSCVQRGEVNPSALSQPRRAEYRDTVPDDLWRAFEPCWAMNPQYRPSISDVLEDLQALD